MKGETVWQRWAELTGLFVLVMGFFLSISMDSRILAYLVIFLAGFLAGRFYFLRIGRQPLFPFFLIIMGFLLGYVIGIPIRTGADMAFVIMLFFIGWIVSHILHKKNLIPK